MLEISDEQNMALTVTEEDKKKKIFDEFIVLTQQRIGRLLEDGEIRSLAFAFDENVVAPTVMTPAGILETVFKVGEKDKPDEAAWKLCENIYQAKMRKFDRLIEIKTNSSDLIAKYKKLQQFAEDNHQYTTTVYQAGRQIRLGVVIQDWVPKWLIPR